MNRRKPFGVYMLLMDGDPWMYCLEKTLADALCTARTLRGDSPLFPTYRVWIATRDVPAHRRRSRLEGIA